LCILFHECTLSDRIQHIDKLVLKIVERKLDKVTLHVTPLLSEIRHENLTTQYKTNISMFQT